MNVAITRAKRFVCLIGDSDTVNSDKFLSELITYFENNGEVKILYILIIFYVFLHKIIYRLEVHLNFKELMKI